MITQRIIRFGNWQLRSRVFVDLTWDIRYHRRCIVERIGAFEGELQFTADQIEDDSKNYHAWAYR